MRIVDANTTGSYEISPHGARETERLDAGVSSNSTDALRQAPIDRFEVSDLAGSVSSALDLAEQSRVTEIEELRTAYSEGTLVVDVAALSRSILEDAVAGSNLEANELP